MDIVSQLEQDYVQAFKKKDELAVLVLRQLKTSIANAEIANNRAKLDEAGLIKLLRSEVKKRRDAAGLYQQGGRAELARKEEQEIEIISRYLPAALSEDQINQKIDEVIAKTGASSVQDMGKVIGAVMASLGGAADGSVVSELIKQKLNKKS
ncbi:MAG: GatB/YqeY domain-containing protein [Candidatus Buchananbacteria bacterium]|nr:GatB/YqeY domain-containing protein [Candidatus Buchananbacteria bacterium]